jgi:hypothetical protein
MDGMRNAVENTRRMWEGHMKSAARKTSKTSEKQKKRTTAIEKRVNEKAAAKKTTAERIARRDNTQTSALAGPEARAEERLRELATWYVLQGMDAATARQRARDEMMRDNPRKDRRRG